MHGILYVDANTENAGLYLLSARHIFKVYESSYVVSNSNTNTTPVINLSNYTVSFDVPAWANIVFISFTYQFQKIDYTPL